MNSRVADTQIDKGRGILAEMPIRTTKKFTKPESESQDMASLVSDTAIGKDQYKLAFICALGDPSKLEKGKKKDSDTGKVTSKIVGAKFEVLDTLAIPVSPPRDDFSKNLMSFDPDNITWETHNAGDIIYMTPFEYGLLLSQSNFNGYCMGGDRPVRVMYTTPRKSKNPMESIDKIPRVTLRPYNSADTYKDTTIEDVLDYTTEIVNEVTGQKRKKKTIKKGFEKWAPLCGPDEAKRGRRPKAKAEEPSKEPNLKAKEYLDRLGNFIPRDVVPPEAEEFDEE